jgi:hypothetical protein
MGFKAGISSWKGQGFIFSIVSTPASVFLSSWYPGEFPGDKATPPFSSEV